MYKILIRPVLFLFDPEKVHHFTFRLLKFFFQLPGIPFLLKSVYSLEEKSLQKEVFGINFPNPVGLAAGLDKDGILINELSSLGFGFIEIGTITPQPQSGNEKKRLFRLKRDQAIINRMGFNNKGVAHAVKQLKKKQPGIIIGGNIGKNKHTPNEAANNDYVICFEQLFPLVDYFVVNVSSLNTPGLRKLQEKEPLKKLLLALKEKNCEHISTKPILLKISPDLSYAELDDVIDIVIETKIDGIIATNTTISRDHLKTNASVLSKIGPGGLSGKPLKERSTEIIRYICKKSNQSFPVIAVGGIHTAEDAIDKLNAGASLVQIYTGFIYEGPSLIKKINKALLHAR